MKIRIQLAIILSILFLGLVGCSGTDTESVLPVTVNNIETESQEQVSEEVTEEQTEEVTEEATEETKEELTEEVTEETTEIVTE